MINLTTILLEDCCFVKPPEVLDVKTSWSSSVLCFASVLKSGSLLAELKDDTISLQQRKEVSFQTLKQKKVKQGRLHQESIILGVLDEVKGRYFSL